MTEASKQQSRCTKDPRRSISTTNKQFPTVNSANFIFHKSFWIKRHCSLGGTCTLRCSARLRVIAIADWPVLVAYALTTGLDGAFSICLN